MIKTSSKEVGLCAYNYGLLNYVACIIDSKDNNVTRLINQDKCN